MIEFKTNKSTTRKGEISAINSNIEGMLTAAFIRAAFVSGPGVSGTLPPFMFLVIEIKQY
jgi:hypothetical protein